MRTLIMHSTKGKPYVYLRSIDYEFRSNLCDRRNADRRCDVASLCKVEEVPVKETIFGTALLVAMTMPFGDLAAAPRQNLGTLTCAAEADPDRTRSLMCTFAPIDGAKAKFRGEIAQIGAEPHVAPKRVLIWSVLGPAGLSPGDLEGKFVRRAAQDSLGRETAPPLIGGAEDTVALEPPSGHEQIPGDPVLTVLVLELRVLKV